MTTRVRHLISGMLLTAVVLTAACSHDKAAIADQDIDPETVPDVIESRDRTRAGQTAPAAGLYLADVDYGRIIEFEAA